MSIAPASRYRIAHLSDPHILEQRPAGRRSSYEMGVRFVSLGRPLDAGARVQKLLHAFRAAERAGADHFVVSGDLTETGTPAQFEAFAEALAETSISPSNITLVPGNHDAYSSGDAWARAITGPLRPYAASSAGMAGHVVERAGVCFLPIDVACHQPMTRSAGELSARAIEALEHRLNDPHIGQKPVVIVSHHPPFRRVGAWQWVDGLRGWAPLMSLLERFPNVHLLHGHMHEVVSRFVRRGRDRIFGAPAVVEDKAPRVRIYEARAGELASVGIAR